jgi:hypothetical protein
MKYFRHHNSLVCRLASAKKKPHAIYIVFVSISAYPLSMQLSTHRKGDFEMLLASTLSELRQYRTRIDKAITVLSALDGSSNHNGNHPPRVNHKGHTMSLAARRKMSRLMKARWASGKMKRS